MKKFSNNLFLITTIIVSNAWSDVENEKKHSTWPNCVSGLYGNDCKNGKAKLYDYYALQEELKKLSELKCRIPHIEELRHLFSLPDYNAQHPNTPNGLFWVEHELISYKGYSWYIDFPSRKIVEYGSLSFSAYFIPTCKLPRPIP